MKLAISRSFQTKWNRICWIKYYEYMKTAESPRNTHRVCYVKGNILDFRGDGIICPCFTDLTLLNKSTLLSGLVNKAGKDVIKELCATGYCYIGSVVIAKGYNLDVKNIIFLPYKDFSESEIMTNTLFHEAVRNAFNIAVLYGLKRVATVPIQVSPIQKSTSQKLLSWIGYENTTSGLTSNESIDILIGLFSGYKDQIDELTIYTERRL